MKRIFRHRRRPGSVQCPSCGRILPPSVPICRCGTKIPQFKGILFLFSLLRGIFQLFTFAIFLSIILFVISPETFSKLWEKIEKHLSKPKPSAKVPSPSPRPKVRPISSPKPSPLQLPRLEDKRIQKVFQSWLQDVNSTYGRYLYTLMIGNLRPSLYPFLADQVFHRNQAFRQLAIRSLVLLGNQKIKSRHGKTVEEVLLKRLKELQHSTNWQEIEDLIIALGVLRSKKARPLVKRILWESWVFSDLYYHLFLLYKRAFPYPRITPEEKYSFPSLSPKIPWEERLFEYTLHCLKIYEAGFFFQAEKLLKKMEKTAPSFFKSYALFLIGKAYLWMEKYEKAFSYLKAALSKKHSKEGENHYYLGILYFRKKQLKKALFHFNKALSFFPKRAEIQFYLSTLYFRLRDSHKGYQFLSRYFILSYSPRMKETYQRQLKNYVTSQILREMRQKK